MGEERTGPSRAAAGIAASLPLLFSAASCCVLPFAVADSTGGADHFVQEMGVWFYVVTATGAVAAAACSVLMFLSARGKRVPVVIALFFATLPWLAGLAGTTVAIGVATDAVALADPSSRAVLMARGVVEASTAKLMGTWIAGSLLSAIGLGWALAALGQRAPGRRGIGALLATAAALPVLGLVAFAFLGAGTSALVLALPGLALVVGSAMAAAGAGEDAPYHRSAAMAAAAPLALGLALAATAVALHTASVNELFAALATVASGSRSALLAAATEDIAPVRLVATFGGAAALLPVTAVTLWAATRGPVSAGRLVGAVLALLLAASLPAASALVDHRTGAALAGASGAPWAPIDGFTPLAMPPSAEYAAPQGVLLADGRIQRPGSGGPSERDAVLPELLRTADEPWGPVDAEGRSVTLAVDATTPAGTLRELAAELRSAGARSLVAVGTSDDALSPAQVETIRTNAPLLAMIGPPLLGVRIDVRPAPEALAARPSQTAYVATVGRTPPVELDPISPDGEPFDLSRDADPLARRGDADAIALLIVGDDATAGSLFLTAARAADHGLAPVLVPTGEEVDGLHAAGGEATSLGDLLEDGALAELGTPRRNTGVGLAGGRAPRPAAAGSAGGRAPRPAAAGSAGAPVVQGSLSRDIVQRVVRRHQNEVRYCYERVLARDPTLAGTVQTRFVVSPQGRVVTASIEESSLESGTVERCITQAIRRWRFPEPQGGGVVVVRYPFTFRSS